ncbi:hypothetical protein bcere0016_43290 [Bacillus cereus 95/8201]|uniref:helix-turn-helix domain-containing protein n=1 Tax=Bacillus cereus group TaxID=86661 RepID=UPI0001A09352|nr:MULTISPECIES: helix-turn-helix domain-containing protein [Bacillus cereus group]EEL14994.1 hypothetical protein bcere0016_43290 [Bacillus cereus 95/8201]AJH63393.1 helix-turn-helix domain protein [Bacillus cereus]AJK35993.1 helix-turn-helix domain protein [Bacillus cereus]KWU69017.1 hypothetical protein AWW71_27935 [Bacillus cereus]MDA2587718.1 helix-turn-helix domain-containing protein [Bacillus cereus group sp. Bc062]
MIQNFTKEEFEKIIEKKDSLSPSSKMLIDVYELLISIYQTVDDKTINELNSYFKNVGVPKFSDVINELNSGNAEVVGVPIIIEEKHITAQEVADITGVTVQMVRRACNEGLIEAERGKQNSWLISQNEFRNNNVIQKWIEDKQKRWGNLKKGQKMLKNDQDFIKILKNIEEEKK